MSDQMHPGASAQGSVTVISVFGTTFQIVLDSAEDYLLHQVFLRFAMICLCVRALLDQGDDVRLLQGWQVAVLWLVVGLTSVVVLVATIALLRILSRAGAGRRVFTPLLFLPLVVAGEYVTQGVIGVFHPGFAKPFEAVLIDLTRDLLVMVMFDAFHALYVAPLHPMTQSATARENGPVATVVAPVEPEAEVGTEEALTDEVPAPLRGRELETVRIGDRAFPLGELVAIRTEDHYLNVITRSGRSMMRAKLSDVVALHDGRHGVQVNRSQWVAFSAITEMQEERNGQIRLELSNGDSVTVARSRRLVFLQLYKGGARRQA